MQVNAQYASTHFEDMAEAVDRGESVEIVRPGKPALRLVSLPAAKSTEKPANHAYIKDGKRILGVWEGEMRVPDGAEWDAIHEELVNLMNGPIFPAADQS